MTYPLIDQDNYGFSMRNLTTVLSLATWSPPVLRIITNSALSTIDFWAWHCEEMDEFAEDGFPYIEWREALGAVYQLLTLSSITDDEEVMPSSCAHNSKQYLAWKFGQVVGRLVISLSKYEMNPLDAISSERDSAWQVDLARRLIADRGLVKTTVALKRSPCVQMALTAAESLVYESYASDAATRLSYCNTKWEETGRWLKWEDTIDFGPGTPLFWAARIGFLEKVVEASPVARDSRTTLVSNARAKKLDPDIESIKDITTSSSIRQIKGFNEIGNKLDRLLAAAEEVRRQLSQFPIGEVWEYLPSSVVDLLTKAESFFSTGTDTGPAKLYFCMAVEAAVDTYYLSPLERFVSTKAEKSIRIRYGGKLRPFRPSQVRSATLRQAAQMLKQAGKDVTDKRSSVDLQVFLTTLVGRELSADSLLPLCRSLEEVAELRGGAAHFHMNYEDERKQLESLRALVLGIDRLSVTVQMVELLRNPFNSETM